MGYNTGTREAVERMLAAGFKRSEFRVRTARPHGGARGERCTMIDCCDDHLFTSKRIEAMTHNRLDVYKMSTKLRTGAVCVSYTVRLATHAAGRLIEWDLN